MAVSSGLAGSVRSAASRTRVRRSPVSRSSRPVRVQPAPSWSRVSVRARRACAASAASSRRHGSSADSRRSSAPGSWAGSTCWASRTSACSSRASWLASVRDARAIGQQQGQDRVVGGGEPAAGLGDGHPDPVDDDVAHGGLGVGAVELPVGPVQVGPDRAERGLQLLRQPDRERPGQQRARHGRERGEFAGDLDLGLGDLAVGGDPGGGRPGAGEQVELAAVGVGEPVDPDPGQLGTGGQQRGQVDHRLLRRHRADRVVGEQRDRGLDRRDRRRGQQRCRQADRPGHAGDGPLRQRGRLGSEGVGGQPDPPNSSSLPRSLMCSILLDDHLAGQGHIGCG